MPKGTLFLSLFLLMLGLGACTKKNEISVTSTDFKFEPLEWTISAGRETSITLINEGTLEHEWVLLKKGMEVTIPFDADDEEKVFWEIEAGPKETTTGTFTAPTEAGTYTVVCGTPGHLEQGMEAALIVK